MRPIRSTSFVSCREKHLILESGETRLRPGNVVIQRGTNHAWNAHGGPALFLAVLIDRDLRHG